VGWLSHSLTIDFDPDQAEFGALLHRVRNFGEDVYRYLRTNDWGEIDLNEVDAATTRLTIRGIKSSKLRRISTWVGEEMRQQHLLGRISSN
jgi:hypothetical protein